MKTAFSRFAQELLLSALGAFACLWALASALELPLETGWLLGVCLGSAAAALGLGRLPRRGAAWLGAPVFVAALWRCWPWVVPGGAVTGSRVTVLYSKVFPAVRATYPLAELSQEEADLCVSVFFLFLGALLSFLLALLLYRGHSAAALLLSALPLAIPLVITKSPADPPFLVLLMVWTLLLLTAGLRRLDPEEASRQGWRLLVPVVLLVATLSALTLPDTVDHHPRFAQELRGRLVAAARRTSYSAPIDPPRMTLPEAGDFSAGPRRYGGGIVLRVKTAVPGPLYLRAYSCRTYTGSAWLPPDPAEENREEGLFLLGMTLRENGVERVQFDLSPRSGGDLLIVPYGIVGAGYQPFNTIAPARAVPVEGDALKLLERTSGRYTLYIYPMDGIEPEALTPQETLMAQQASRQAEAYLELPEETRRLAQDWARERGITAGEDRWAVAQEVKNRLRAYDYTLQVEAPPEGTDLMAWFLDRREGYCVHYATTATAVLRSLGIPARYVSGYLANRTDAENWVSVRDFSAHAWVEVFLEGIGWYPLEVTPSGNAAASPSPSASASAAPSVTPSPEETGGPASAKPTPSAAPTGGVDGPGAVTAAPGASHGADPGTEEARRVWSAAAWILLALLAPALLPGGMLRLCRRARTRGRDRRKAASALWRYLRRQYRRGSPPARAKALAEKAKFSREGITEEERRELEQIAREAYRQRAEEQPGLIRPLWRLWWGI